MLEIIGLLIIGVAVGTYASLVGVGGGIAMVPVLLIFYHLTPQGATGISLAVIIFNAASASIAYGRKRRIDYHTGLLFACGAIPGAVLGASTVAHIPRHIFSAIFGIFLVGLAVFILFRPEKRWEVTTDNKDNAVAIVGAPSRHRWTGIPLGVIIGFIGSLLGIGGGILYVPVFVYLLNFTVHRAVATSLFVIGIMAVSGAVTHFINGVYIGYVHVIGLLAAGMVAGAQLGAKISDVAKGRFIIRAFALVLLAVGIRLFAEML